MPAVAVGGGGMNGFALLVRQEIRLNWAAAGPWLAVGFFLSAAALMPLGIGSDAMLLSRIAAGALWVLAALSALLSLDRLFAADAEDGTLDLLALSPLSLEAVGAAKILAHWLSTGVPLVVVAVLPALLFDLSVPATKALLLSLLPGTLAISALGAIGAALTLATRRGGLLLPLIVLPLMAPVVIFGAGAVLAVQSGLDSGALYFLAAVSLLAVLLAPFAVGAGLRLHLAQ
ncbi:MAG: heme exporter protein CcmB [Rhizomicrobium sp.]